MKKVFLFVIIFIFLMVLMFGLSRNKEQRVCFARNCFFVETADNAAEQALGLMFRKSMPQNHGMLFVYGGEDIRPFWMKNTLMPLDIIWLDKEMKIVFISRNTQPCGKESCPTINPGKKSQYVLEINAGISDKLGFKVGDKAEIK